MHADIIPPKSHHGSAAIMPLNSYMLNPNILAHK
ncbi:hypothetical protein VPHK165_0063 [Vibrio phage K165]